MKAIELANDLREALVKAKSQGIEQVRIEQLLNYLDQVRDDDDVTSTNHELMKAQFSLNIEHSRQTHESGVEAFKAAVTSGQSAIRSLFILNGGACIAMLAFIGHLATDNSRDLVGPFAWTLLAFAAGVFAAAVTSGLTYLTQVLFADDDTEKFGFGLQFASVAVGLSSLLCFAIGMRRAYEAFAAF